MKNLLNSHVAEVLAGNGALLDGHEIVKVEATSQGPSLDGIGFASLIIPTSDCDNSASLNGGCGSDGGEDRGQSGNGGE